MTQRPERIASALYQTARQYTVYMMMSAYQYIVHNVHGMPHITAVCAYPCVIARASA
jgi:hypothetical protein